MLVTKLAGQALRPKRIGSLTLPLASFGDRSNEALEGQGGSHGLTKCFSNAEGGSFSLLPIVFPN